MKYVCSVGKVGVVEETYLDVYEYKTNTDCSVGHLYKVPDDPSYLDKWRKSNPDCHYSEPFRIRITTMVEMVGDK